jgi:hypothetical protein
MARMVACLSSTHKVLSSNSSTIKKYSGPEDNGLYYQSSHKGKKLLIYNSISAEIFFNGNEK